MKTSALHGVRDTFALLLLAFSFFTQMTMAAGALWSAHPTIQSIRLEGAEVVIAVEVPGGLKKITLQSSSRLGTGAWTPRAVSRMDAKGGTIVFRIPKSPELELVRVRADETDPLPASFYQGTNRFPGVAVTSYFNPELTVFGAGANAGAPVSDDKAVAAPSASRDVVESDIWKIEGDVLYFFNQYRGLQVINVAQPDSPVVLGTLALPAAGEQMYLIGGNHVVLLARDGCSYAPQAGSQVLLVDVAQGSPTVAHTLPLGGEIQESRMVGTALYVTTQTYRPAPGAVDGSWEWGTAIHAFDLSDLGAPVSRPSLFYTGYGNVISATDQFLFVSVTDNQGDSIIHCVDISNPDGTMQKSSSIRVAGRVADKFKMQLQGSVFTVISEKWSSQLVNGGSRWAPVTKLETFSLAAPAAPAKLGELELARGEQLHATRFDGERVYVVTYFRVDPLWIVDLSNPARPEVKGELHVPGWSTYIQPLGDQLLTIGIDDTNGWRVAVSLFDVHDTAAPKLLSKVPLGENSSWSEANYDEKAFGFLPDAGLVLVPFSSYSTNNQQGVQLIDFTGQSLVKRGFISHDMQARRSTLHRDRILSLSGRELLSVEASDRDKPVVRSKTELAWPVNKVFVQDGYLLQIETSAAWADVTSPTVRVARAGTPEQIVNSFTLTTNLPIAGAALRDGRLYLLQATTTYSPIFFVTADGKAAETGTNQTTLRCSVLDTRKLPALELLSATEMVTGESFNGSATAAWPKPDLLVWITQQANYWRGFFPVVDLAMGVSLAPVQSIGLWYPFGGWGESKLFAVDVRRPEELQFVSEVSLSSTNGWANFSKPYAAEGAIFLSRQTTETTITGTNIFLVTNTVSVLTTNVAWVTNYTKVPNSTIVTNYTVVTNVSIIAIGNRLGGQSLMNTGGSTAFMSPGEVLGGGAFHSLGLTADGQVWTWGDNSHGQLGAPEPSARRVPNPVPGLGGIRAIASGEFHNLALKSDGTVWAWGDDVFGQLGNGIAPFDPTLPPMPEMPSSSPVQVLGLQDVAAISAGYWHSFAVQSDGSVLAWGANWAGQLGDGSFADQARPVRLALLREVVQIAGGQEHSLALQRDGTVWSWGGNDAGQLGDGSTVQRNAPARIPGFSDIVSVAAGHSHNLALRKDGTVWSWGLNGFGQLGDGTANDSSRPIAVPELSDVVSIACGQSHSLAVRRDGSVWAWGRAKEGQAGAVPVDDLRPTLVEAVSPLVIVGAGSNHSLGATSGGELVYAWGDNSYGQLGSGTVLSRTNTFVETNLVKLVTWSEETEVVLRTNIVRVPQSTVVGNEQPLYVSRQVSYLNVVDYTAPANPVLRPPVTVPGTLQGLAHEGALLYFQGANLDTNVVADGVEWLHACAYDGVSCYLVDSHALPKEWPHATLVRDPYVLITRPAVDKAAAPALEVWTISDAARFVKTAERGLKANGSLLQAVSDILVVQEDNGLELLDLSRPTELPSVGGVTSFGCVGWNLEAASGSMAEGLWLPLDFYGVYHIPVTR